MRKLKQPAIDDLLLDVIEYAFVEWLVRRGIFTAFRVNYDRDPMFRKTFRDCLRNHIRYVYRSSCLGPESLISSAFPFDRTPEGYEFWIKHSDAWKRFYGSLQIKR